MTIEEEIKNILKENNGETFCITAQQLVESLSELTIDQAQYPVIFIPAPQETLKKALHVYDVVINEKDGINAILLSQDSFWGGEPIE